MTTKTDKTQTEPKGFPTTFTCRDCKTTVPASVPCKCERGRPCPRCGSGDVDLVHGKGPLIVVCMACANCYSNRV